MAQSNVIREFLVAIGFKIDQSALTNFISGIEKVTKAVMKLGAAVSAMVATAVIGIQRFASNLEQLYFASLRTGSSAANLKAFDRAMQDFGASAGEGLAMVESLAHALRTNPGNVGFIESFIGPVKRLKDGTIDAEDAMERLAKSASFLAQPDFVKFQIGSQFGLNDNQVLRLINGDFLGDLDKKKKELGPNWEEASKHAHQFMSDLRDLQTLIESFGVKVEDVLQRKLGFSIKSLSAWLEKNGDWLADRIVSAIEKLIDVAKKLQPILEWVVDKFKAADEATGGWSTKILAMIAVLKVLGAGEVIGGILTLAGAFWKLADGIGAANAASIAGGARGAAGGLIAFLGRLGFVGALVNAGFDLTKVFTGKGPGGIFWNLLDKTGAGEWLDRVGSKMGLATDQERFAKENPLQFILDQANGRLTREQAAAFLANFKGESNLDPNAKNGSHYGLGQWDKSRQADFAAFMGHDIHGTGAAEQYLFGLHELLDKSGKFNNVGVLLQGMSNVRAATGLLYREYEKPTYSAAEEARRGDLAAKIDQTVTINIDGSKDPTATGKEVESAIDRSNARLARNFWPVK